jgi:hypothetical protein
MYAPSANHFHQIVAGMSDGSVAVLYSPETSLHGAKLPMSKGPRKKITIEDVSDAVSAPTILTPHALPMYADGEMRGGKRKREKDRSDPRKSRRPELPLTGPGKGGRVGASATQHVVQNLVRDTTRDEDVSGSAPDPRPNASTAGRGLLLHRLPHTMWRPSARVVWRLWRVFCLVPGTRVHFTRVSRTLWRSLRRIY